ncbi:hypothetical protein M3Y99_00819900 [Aphelenchoides fujianensis]|nr:hypothetical protein M3Y99_00819900 [Aphelenchoides fujianensis]
MIAATFNSKKFADVEVRVQVRVFPVSRMIICSGSPPVFAPALVHPQPPSPTPHVSREQKAAWRRAKKQERKVEEKLGMRPVRPSQRLVNKAAKAASKGNWKLFKQLSELMDANAKKCRPSDKPPFDRRPPGAGGFARC